MEIVFEIEESSPALAIVCYIQSTVSMVIKFKKAWQQGSAPHFSNLKNSSYQAPAISKALSYLNGLCMQQTNCWATITHKDAEIKATSPSNNNDHKRIHSKINKTNIII